MYAVKAVQSGVISYSTVQLQVVVNYAALRELQLNKLKCTSFPSLRYIR